MKKFREQLLERRGQYKRRAKHAATTAAKIRLQAKADALTWVLSQLESLYKTND